MKFTSIIKSNQPKGVFAIFFIQLLGMIGFSMIFSLIVLYCTHVLGFSDDSAYAISASFNALAFALSVPGGYLAERFLGYKSATLLSMIISAVGLFLMAVHSLFALYLGLGFFLMGTGMIIPCLFVLLGTLYNKKNQTRENGFVLSYVGMNVGSFMASAMSGSVANNWGYSFAFIIGAVTALMMIPVLFRYQHVFKESVAVNKSSLLKGLGCVFLLVIVTSILIEFSTLCNSLMMVLGAAAFVFIMKLSLRENELVKHKLWIFVLLTVLSIVFWALYSLSPSLLTIFAERNVDRHVWGWVIPTATLSSLNPFFIITIGPLMAFVWLGLKKINIKVSTPMKFAMGIVLMGAGFLILALGVYQHNTLGFVALIWLVLSYFLQTVGELMVGPIGYAMVGELVPKKSIGVMMGVWQLSAGLGGACSEFLARYSHTQAIQTPLVSDAHFAHAFSLYGWVTVAVGVLAMTIAPRLQKVMRQS